MQDQLVIFGYTMMGIFALTILVPYLLRWSELITTWNLFLIGAINFVGYAAVQSGKGVYNYGLFTPDDYSRLMMGTLVFFAALYFTYYRGKRATRFAGHTLRRWPAYSGVSLAIVWAACMGLLAWSVFFPNVQFVGQIIIIVGPTAGMIATALIFRRWLDNRGSGVLLAFLIGTLGLVLVGALHGGTGRRQFLSALMTLPICYYWIYLRHRPLNYTLVPLAISGFAVVVVMAGYTTIRHRYNAEVVNITGRTSIQTAIESLRMLPTAIMNLRGVLNVFGGDSMEASLVSINRYTKTNAPPEPFHVAKFVVVNPIPRAFWPDKPKALGETLPRDTGVWYRGYVNWGPGIAGHGFHEGGTALGGMLSYIILIIYAVICGWAMRFFDELMLRQPDNPYLLGIFAGASGQIIAFSRGDIGLFAVLILGAVLAGLIVKWIGRLFVGYKLIYPSDQERLAAAQAAAAPAYFGAPAETDYNGGVVPTYASMAR